MTEPEILDAEPAEARAAGDAGRGLLERLLAELNKALPGRVVRVEGNNATIAGGADGDVTIQITPLFVLVGFRGARLPVLVTQAPEKIASEAAAKAARFATDELVVFEEQETAGLLRTTIVAVKNGRLHGVVDDGQVPTQEPAAAPRLYSCQGSFSRAPTRDEQKWIARETGGFTGKLKRKLIAKVFKKVGASLETSLQGRVEEIQADRGQRTLGPRG